ncbi:MAG: hypothetical protein QM754_03810 [Tepidisphaeraceae bacterium]
MNWRVLFFATNGSLLLSAAVWVVVEVLPYSSFEYWPERVLLGLVPIWVVWAIGEWILYSRRHQGLETTLGILIGLWGMMCLAISFFLLCAMFGLVASPPFEGRLFLVCSVAFVALNTLGFYSLFCCGKRITHESLKEPVEATPGFDVIRKK